MPPVHSLPIDITRDATKVQKTFVEDGSAKDYKGTLIRVMIWLYDTKDYKKYLSDHALRKMNNAQSLDHQSRGNQRTKLRTCCKILLNLVSSENSDNNHKSPIRIDGEVILPWVVIREYMNSLKRKISVDKKLAMSYIKRISAEEGISPPTVTGSNPDGTIDLLASQSLSSYEAVRSCISYLHRLADVVMDQRTKQQMSQFIAGCKRTIANEKQLLGQKITEGKEPMSVEVFEYISKELFVSEDPEESLFGHLFFLLDWNLMKRAENCEKCKINHIYWSGDALIFEFAKSKGDQEGKFHGPWHCYANPEKPHLCLVLAMAKYCLTYSDVCSKGAPLFEGTSQYNRYTKMFHSFVRNHAERLRDMGVKPGDLGTHSVRKGVATMVASGCTVSPPIVSLCIRVGWVMGGVKDKYLFNEAF